MCGRGFSFQMASPNCLPCAIMELYDFLSFVFLVTISIVALKANFQDICSAVTPSDMVCLYAASCDGLIKEARCTYVLTPYRNLANRSAPSA